MNLEHFFALAAWLWLGTVVCSRIYDEDMNLRKWASASSFRLYGLAPLLWPVILCLWAARPDDE